MKDKSPVRYKEHCPASMEKPPFQTDEPLPVGDPMPSPMPEPEPRGTEYTEYRESDCIEAPIEGINSHMMRHVSSLIQVSSTGLFRVGDRFHNFQSGFASYCVFITLEGQGRCRYRGIARERQTDTHAENASAPSWVTDAMRYMSVNYRENQRISDIYRKRAWRSRESSKKQPQIVFFSTNG